MRVKLFNPQVFIESLCYLVFGGLTVYLTESQRYLDYVTPRMKPYLYFTAAVMLVYAAVSLCRLFRPQHRVRYGHAFVLVVPILLLLLPHSPLSASDLAVKYTGQGAWAGSTASSSSSALPSAPALPDSSPSSASGYVTALPGLDEENKSIVIGDDHFYPWISEIFANIDKYEGYQVTITGFVYKDPTTMSETEFVAARLAMVCCVADLAPLGLLVSYEDAPRLEQEQWVTIQGTLTKTQFMGFDEPQLQVISITPAEEVRGYLYPY